jgi:hypothetical protein
MIYEGTVILHCKSGRIVVDSVPVRISGTVARFDTVRHRFATADTLLRVESQLLGGFLCCTHELKAFHLPAPFRAGESVSLGGIQMSQRYDR